MASGSTDVPHAYNYVATFVSGGAGGVDSRIHSRTLHSLLGWAIWAYENTKKGWMTQDIFLVYLREQFYPFVNCLPVIAFPILLLVDGASSHISFEVSGINEIFESELVLQRLGKDYIMLH